MDEETARMFDRIQRELEQLRGHETPLPRCAALYTTDAGQSIPYGAFTIVDFENLVHDTDAAVTTGASWKFTCPTGQGGQYRVSIMLLFTSTSTWAAAEHAEAFVYKGGVAYTCLARTTAESATTLYRELNGSADVYLSAAEYIDIRVFQGSGGAIALANDGLYNHVSISRI